MLFRNRFLTLALVASCATLGPSCALFKKKAEPEAAAEPAPAAEKKTEVKEPEPLPELPKETAALNDGLRMPDMLALPKDDEVATPTRTQPAGVNTAAVTVRPATEEITPPVEPTNNPPKAVDGQQ